MTRRAAALVILIGAIVAIPIAVVALTSGRSSRLDRQANVTASKPVSTSSTTWHDVPGLTDLHVCALGQVTAMLSVNVSGAPVRFRVLYDDGPSLFPARTEFAPGSGTRGFSFDFVGRASTFEGSDGHVYTAQWRSAGGGAVTLHGRLLDLLYHLGAHC